MKIIYCLQTEEIWRLINIIIDYFLIFKNNIHGHYSCLYCEMILSYIWYIFLTEWWVIVECGWWTIVGCVCERERERESEWVIWLTTCIIIDNFTNWIVLLFVLLVWPLFITWFSPEACAAILWKTAKASPKVYTMPVLWLFRFIIF